MNTKHRVALVFQRSPLPIRSGADRRVSEMLDALASQCDFVSLLVLSYVTPETREFCRQRNIVLRSIIHINGLYSLLTYIKRVIDALFHQFPQISPLRLLRVFGIRLTFLQRKAGKPDDPYWAICCDPLALKVAKFVREQKVDAVIVEYIWLTGCIRHLPHKVLKLIDTHDVMHLRKRAFAGQFVISPEFGVVGREDECVALDNFDCIIAIQATEKSVFREMLPNKKVITVPSGSNTSFLDNKSQMQLSSGDISAQNRLQQLSGTRFLFLGGGHAGNVLALRNLIENIWPCVLESSDANYASLIIAGDISQAVSIEACYLLNIIVLGYVDRTDWLYDTIDVVLNPVFSGSGLKIKTVEALAHKKLVITTPTGIEGISPSVENCCLVAHTPDQFCELMLAVLADQIDRPQILKNLATYVDQYFSPEAQYRELFDFLDTQCK